MNNTAKLGLLTPALLNPATAALVGIAAIAVGIYRILPDDDEEATVEGAAINRSKEAIPTVEAALPAVEGGKGAPVSELSNEAQHTAPMALERATTQTPDPDQSEMIRKTMSELGKRSAAARARKKAQHKVDS